MKLHKQHRAALFLKLWFIVSAPLVILTPLYARPLIYFCSPRFELGDSTFKGDVDGIRDALNRGANIDARDGYAGRNALMLAALHGHTKAAAFLVTQGAEIDAVDDKGLTARQLAIDAKHFDTAAVLKGR